MSAGPAVCVRSLTVRLGKATILDGLDLDVAPGELVVLLGPSGCGKSTLLNAIAGLVDVAAGEVRIGGNDVTLAEPKDRGIGMVFQSYALYPSMSVAKNLAFGLRVAGTPAAVVRRRVSEVAGVLRLEGLMDRRPAALSGGQRQRVAIGRALVKGASVFLFDEPLSNVDAQLRAELRAEIRLLHRSFGPTMIYVTHDQTEAMTLADRIGVMKAGRIVQIGPPADVYRRPVDSFVAGFVGSPQMVFVPGAVHDAEGEPVFRAGPLALPLAGFPKSVPRGKAVLGVRPEHVAVRPACHGEGVFEARVDLVEPMGADTVLRCVAGGVVVPARVEADAAVRTGDAVRLAIDPRRISLFDAATGRAYARACEQAA
jgi:multiple sugar transport system ATP-binding protein